jgi:hypothetical protein
MAHFRVANERPVRNDVLNLFRFTSGKVNREVVPHFSCHTRVNVTEWFYFWVGHRVRLKAGRKEHSIAVNSTRPSTILAHKVAL